MKAGTIASVTDYVRINKVNGTSIDVTNLHTGTNFTVHGQVLLDEMKSADEFQTTKQVTKTELAEILNSAYNIALQVKFVKSNGEDRVIRGRMTSSEPLMGRSYVEDLDLPDKKNRIRLVDHRTLKYVIVDGVKYESK